MFKYRLEISVTTEDFGIKKTTTTTTKKHHGFVSSGIP